MAIKKLWLVKAAFMLAVFADSGMAEDTSDLFELFETLFEGLRCADPSWLSI